MTKNQIEYAKLLESMRSNREQEEIQKRKLGEEINLGYAQLKESSRHNLVSESLDSQKVTESYRHNREQEKLGFESLYEDARHNLAYERQNMRSLSESARHNKAVEAETARHNTAGERETLRSNLVGENLQRLSQSISLSAQDVQKRGQSLNYELGMAQVGLGYSQLSETMTAHRASEALEAASISQRQEQARLSFSLGTAQLAETSRHSQAVEAETRRSNLAVEAEQSRTNLAREGETARHNYQMEMQQSNELLEAQRHNRESEKINMAGVNVGGLRETTNTIDHVMKWLNLDS